MRLSNAEDDFILHTSVHVCIHVCVWVCRWVGVVVCVCECVFYVSMYNVYKHIKQLVHVINFICVH